ncbi:hypothetical protein EVG20_g1823 [Dentipellis fragilis]|uniref:FAM86 N-terminal domain-containing protein n=1 Tax=Dentipellis fragilis TaxID=205917 RepID=A0A4Y9Z9M6_9AGAM|nr:hypothetical protein EVG20_g1823 [Dentipellis fragilis]
MSPSTGIKPELLGLLRGYGALISPNLLHFPIHLPFTYVHDFLLDSILLNGHFVEFPPSDHYQTFFWKWVISHLETMAVEEEDLEIDTRFYDRHIALLSAGASTSQAPPPSFITYFFEDSLRNKALKRPGSFIGLNAITLLESRTTIESGTTGLRTWTASFVLACLLASQPNLIIDRNVMELGAGSGFLGVFTAHLQLGYGDAERMPSICLTDVNDEVLQRCNNNIRLPCNSSSRHQNISVRSLDWTDAMDADRTPHLQRVLDEIDPDIILGADIVYHPDIIPALVATLKLALETKSERHREVFLVLTVRNESTLERFVGAVTAEASLCTEELVPPKNAEDMFLPPQGGPESVVRIFKISIRR